MSIEEALKIIENEIRVLQKESQKNHINGKIFADHIEAFTIAAEVMRPQCNNKSEMILNHLKVIGL